MIDSWDRGYVVEIAEMPAPLGPRAERRQGARHRFHGELRVTPLEEPNRPAHEFRTRRCLAIDISDRGVRLLWPGGGPPNHVLLDGVDSAPLAAKVQWWKQVAPNRLELGLSFER